MRGYGLRYPTYQQRYGYPDMMQGYPGQSFGGYDQGFGGGGQGYPQLGGYNQMGFGQPQARQQGGGITGAGQQIGMGIMPFNPLLGGAIAGGSALLGGLGRLIGGPSAGERRAKETYGLAKGQLGKDVLRPEAYMADYRRSMEPQFARMGEMINRRLGLDVGVGQSELAHRMQAPLAGFRWQTMQEADRLKSERDMALYRLMASLGEV